jgi:hypothetical protein
MVTRAFFDRVMIVSPLKVFFITMQFFPIDTVPGPLILTFA